MGEASAAPSTCRNCGAPLVGPYCAQCAQPAHIHRSLASLGHDILHGVFHFEGKFWRTIPALVLRPGELTRRYIEGERAKFVSPMALFLFTVFAMFAAFSLLGGSDVNAVNELDGSHRAALESTNRQITALRGRLTDPHLAATERAAVEDRIAQLESWRVVTQALSPSDAVQPQPPAAREVGGQAQSSSGLNKALQRLNENPRLLLYKLKTNGYKFSWALIPLSIPFMWLLFCWRRDIHLYDHAVFVTYSLSFMMLFAIVLAALGSIGLHEDVLESAMVIVPPVHIYRQLRGAYQLSRKGAAVRLVFVLLSAVVVLGSFGALLLAMGVLG